jgi:superfamily II DNA or RNA helicase
VAVTLTIFNRYVRVDGADLKTTRALDAACSYRVAGYWFSPAYKSRRWDGKEHLFKFTKKRGYHAPSGMAEDIARLLKKRKVPYTVVFDTQLRSKPRRFSWSPDVVLRDYQNEAVRALLGGVVPGRGVLKMPVRAGKTKTIARVLYCIGRRALFVVPSRWLLHQTIASLHECMPDAPIGQIGDGVYDVKFFTVATIQSLAMMAPVRKTRKKKGRAAHPDYATLMSSFDVGVFDEAHHVRGDGDWYRVFVDLNARFKIGVSATIFFDSTKEQESGIIWLRATCGPIRYEVSASRLITAGYLLPQTVKMYRVHEPAGLRHAKYSATLKKQCITENARRNEMIASIVRDYAHADKPRKTIVIARELAHIRAIGEALDQLDVQFRVLTGSTSQDQRTDFVDDFCSKRGPHVLVGNVLGEGVDIPDVEIVVNAEGGKDEKQTWQRQRNLTVVQDSDKVPVMIDFYDEMSAVFEKHSKARLKVYRSEAEFSAEVLECDAD